MIKYIMILLVTLSAVAFSQEKSVVKKDSIKTPIVTLIEIGSVNCIPCKKMSKILDEIKEEYCEKVEIVFHNVWTQKGKIDARKYKYRLIPTQVFLDSTGKEYFRHEGFFPKKNIIKKLAEQGLKK